MSFTLDMHLPYLFSPANHRSFTRPNAFRGLARFQQRGLGCLRFSCFSVFGTSAAEFINHDNIGSR